MKAIGERIKKAREGLGLDQAAFGQSIGVASRDTVSRWERGLSFPSADNLALMSEKHGICVGWIVTGKGQMLPPGGSEQSKDETEQKPQGLRLIARDKTVHFVDDGTIDWKHKVYDAAIFAVLEGQPLIFEQEPVKAIPPERQTVIYKNLVHLLSEFRREELTVIAGVIRRWIESPLSKEEKPKQP